MIFCLALFISCLTYPISVCQAKIIGIDPNQNNILSLDALSYTSNLQNNFSVTWTISLPDNVILDKLSFQVCIDPSTFISTRLALKNWSDGDNVNSPVFSTCQTTPKYDLTKSQKISFSAKMSNFGFDKNTIWGPKRVYISDVDNQIEPLRTFTVFDGIARPSKPINISLLTHLTDTSYYKSNEDEQNKALLQSLSAGGNLNKLSKLFNFDKNISLDIDPSLLTNLETLSQNNNSKLINLFKNSLKNHPTYYLPYDDINLTSLTHNNKTLDNLGVYNLIDAKQYKNPNKTLAWFNEGQLDNKTLTQTKLADIQSAVVDLGDDTSNNVFTPSPKITLTNGQDQITAYSPDNILSTTLSGQATNNKAFAENTATGRISRFLAESAFINMELPSISRNILSVFNRSAIYRFSDDDLDNLTKALSKASWINFAPLSDITSQPATQQLNLPNPIINQNQLLPIQIDNIYNNLNKIAIFSEGTKLYNSTQNFIYNYAARLMSTSLEYDTNQRNNLLTQMDSVTNSLLDSVKINTSGALNILASDVQFSVNIKNSLSKKIKLDLYLVHNNYISANKEIYNVELESNSQQSINVPIHARANGNTTLELLLQGQNGVPINNPTKINVNIFVQFTTVGTIFFFILLPILFIIGIIRTIKKRRLVQTRQKGLDA
jgi:hypothetical protein